MNEAIREIQTINRRYELRDQLGEGSLGIVFRAYDKLRTENVALKIIQRKFRQSSMIELDEQNLLLANEFRILAGLRHPNIISVLDYGFDDNQFPFFTMSLVENGRAITSESSSLPDNKIRILVEFLTALSFLHHRGIIHRDLKPQNILITGDGQVKVLDFGLAILRHYASGKAASISGTLQYIAPEVLRGEPAGVLSDLYSAGVIAYELYTGHYPYALNDINQLIDDILHKIPDLTGFSDEWAMFLGRLLAKDPLDRYVDTEATIQSLQELMQYSLPDKRVVFSETVLQSTRFVGRETEIQLLKDLLDKTKQARGALYLIAGESGVGKTRLLNETRIHALIDNLVVMRGNAKHDAIAPYGLWQDILRWLAILTPLNLLEASVLKLIVPDIDRLVPFDVADAPDLSIQATQERIVQVITNLMKRQSQSILMLMEDLQWADRQSLELLHTVSEIITDLPILILGSVRDDSKNEIEILLSHANTITLSRFDDREVVELSDNVLGTFNYNSKLIEYVIQETRGNALFIIEVFRNLSSLASGLQNIINFSFPLSLTLDGIMATLEQRLENIPPEAMKLLEYAAVAGHDIDAKLMQQLFPNENIEQWLLVCSEHSVIEAHESRWSFAHSKLREFILNSLDNTSSRWKEMNRDIAVAIEAVYPKDETYTISLATHWTQAEESRLALPYLEKSAMLVTKSAPNLAIQFIETANQLDIQQKKSDDHRLALHYSILGNAYYSLGDNDNASAHFARAIQYMGYRPAPASGLQSAFGLLQQLAVQTAHRMFPGRFIHKKDNSHFRSLMYYALLNAQVVHLYRGEDTQALYTVLLTLNAVEALKPGTEFSSTLIYAAMTLFSSLAGLNGVARYYHRLTETTLDEGSQVHRIQALALLGVYAFQQGQWQKAMQLCSDVLAQFEAMGDMHDFDEGRNVLARVYQQSGDDMRALELLEAAYRTTKERKDMVVRFALFTGIAYLKFRSGAPLDSIEDSHLFTDAEYAGEVFAEAFHNNQSNKALYSVAQSAYQFDHKNYQEAYASLVRGKASVKSSIERNWNYFELYALMPEICYRLLRQATEPLTSDQQSVLRAILEASQLYLKKYAKIFIYAQPMEAIADGWMAEISQNSVKAVECYQRAIALADKLETPQYKALANDMIGTQA